MILVEGHWERVNDLRDVSRIIREYYNSELAYELDGFIDEIEMSVSDEDIRRLEELEDLVEEIRTLVG